VVEEVALARGHSRHLGGVSFEHRPKRPVTSTSSCARRGYNGVASIPTREEASMGQMKEFAGVFYREGALDPKTMQLVALAAMAAAGCTS
jgi:carboxymuconolactone decarboxylase family protein